MNLWRSFLASRWCWAWVGAAVVLGVACGPSDHPPPPAVEPSPVDAGDALLALDADLGPPSLDAAGYCGNQLIRTRLDEKNLYFVVDRSGSMAEDLPGSTNNRYRGAIEAIAALLLEIGHRVSYGAAVFPGGDDCAVGREIYPTHPGDPANYAATGTSGPVLTSFVDSLFARGPLGGTPLSRTLVALEPTLRALPGEKFVIIATDGSPNCNPEARCTSSECNLTGYSLPDGRVCGNALNCCDPEVDVPGVNLRGPENCVDGPASRTTIARLAEQGIKTYVLGLPGAVNAEALLNELALAGGTARGGVTQYYPANTAQVLTDQLRQIGAQVTITCVLELDEPPPDPALVNVYFDRTVLPANSVSGWTFTDARTITIHGDACSQIERGDVLNVQIVAGCPTEVR